MFSAKVLMLPYCADCAAVSCLQLTPKLLAFNAPEIHANGTLETYGVVPIILQILVCWGSRKMNMLRILENNI